VRCPECSHNQRYKSGMVCGNCRYRFVLDPKRVPFLADRRFMKGIEDASAGGTRSYTPGQLHGVIFRRRNRGFWRRFSVARGSSEVEATRGALAAWRRAGRDPGPLVERPGLESPSGSDPPWPEPDLFDYGAEGILAVDEPLLVDLLVRHRVHTVCKVVILEGQSGYPEPTAARLAPFVAARPDVPIFLLHDTSGDAAPRLEQAVRELLGTADNPVIDLGLPLDVSKRIPAMRWSRRLPVVRADMLPYRWLTDGVASAIAHRVSLVDLLRAPPESSSGDTDAQWWVVWDHVDFDFG
jgi:hypothetical protein